jgi:hypothetical protein
MEFFTSHTGWKSPKLRSGFPHSERCHRYHQISN